MKTIHERTKTVMNDEEMTALLAEIEAKGGTVKGILEVRGGKGITVTYQIITESEEN